MGPACLDYLQLIFDWHRAFPLMLRPRVQIMGSIIIRPD
eukprot:COSAG01_NODE_6619_length_3575_cov_2.058976_3_plen_39_part_00